MSQRTITALRVLALGVLLLNTAATVSALFELMGLWFLSVLLLLPLLEILRPLVIVAAAVLSFLGTNQAWGWPIWVSALVSVPVLLLLVPSWAAALSGKLVPAQTKKWSFPLDEDPPAEALQDEVLPVEVLTEAVPPDEILVELGSPSQAPLVSAPVVRTAIPEPPAQSALLARPVPLDLVIGPPPALAEVPEVLSPGKARSTGGPLTWLVPVLKFVAVTFSLGMLLALVALVSVYGWGFLVRP